MKALASMPLSGTLMKILGRQAPVPVPVATATYLRPVEMRRYLRCLRESRHSYLSDQFFN
jgi:hypothetical protein